MTNLHQRSKAPTLFTWRVTAASLAVLVIFAVDAASGGGIRGTLRTLPAFLFDALTHLPSASFWHSQTQLAQENEDLKYQLAQAHERILFADAVQNENAQLHALVRLATSTRGVAEPILSSFLSSPYGTFLISADSGSISVGNYVVSPSGFVIGRVTEVSHSTALVTFLFSHDSAVEASIGSTTAILTGRSTGNADTRVARGITVATGTIVVAKGALNRPIGVVGAVLSDPASAYSNVEVSLPVNLSSLRYIYVVSR